MINIESEVIKSQKDTTIQQEKTTNNKHQNTPKIV